MVSCLSWRWKFGIRNSEFRIKDALWKLGFRTSYLLTVKNLALRIKGMLVHSNSEFRIPHSELNRVVRHNAVC